MANMSSCRVCASPDATAFFTDKQGRAYFRCAECEATMLAPEHFLGAEAERAHYLTHENDVDDRAYRAFLSRLADPLLARLPPNSSGLDYGCGPGPALAAMLCEAGHKMAVYDPYFAPDPAPLSETYDFITCTETAEHMHDPRAELARLAAMLRPGGILAVMTMFQTEDARFETWHYRLDPTHVVFYRARTFEVIGQRLGMTCEIVRKDVVFLTKGPDPR